MIDITKAENEFKKYTNTYDIDDPNIQRKIHHSFRVEALSNKIAKSLKLSSEEIALATLIGLLHDIGRFEQYKKFHTFSDSKSVDHGSLGASSLKQDDFIRNFIENSKYDHLIEIAIFNHNKLHIPNDLSKTEEIFCKIVRDSDKLDIFYEAENIFWKDEIPEINSLTISKEVKNCFLNKQIIDKKYRKNKLDGIVGIISFIFDLNFPISYQILKDANYINNILGRFSFQNDNTKLEIENIRNLANSYINYTFGKKEL